MSGIITLAFTMSVVYKQRSLGVLEVSFLLNMVVLAVATYYITVSGGSQAAATFTSIGIAFTTFAGIVIFHIFLQIRKTNCFRKVCFAEHYEEISPQENEQPAVSKEVSAPNYSSVTLREPLLGTERTVYVYVSPNCI